MKSKRRKNLKIHIFLQYLLDCQGHNNSKITGDLTAVDRSLDTLGIVQGKKRKIFNILAAILHLGNVVFEENDESIGKKCIRRLSFIGFNSLNSCAQ